MKRLFAAIVWAAAVLAQETPPAQPGKVEAPEEEITVFGEQRQRLEMRRDARELALLEDQLRQRFGLNRPSPSPDRLLDRGVVLTDCARLEVQSRPDGAEIFLNGRILGQTPSSTGDLPCGRHVLTLRSRGYELWRNPVMLPPWNAARVTATLDRRISYQLDAVWSTEQTQDLPSGLAVLRPGEVFVSGGGKVKLWARGKPVRELRADGMTEPRGMALSVTGQHLYVADPGCHSVWCFDAATGALVMRLVEGGGQSLHQPTDVAVGPDGRVLVCDSGNHRLVWFSPQGQHVATWGGRGDTPGMFQHPEGAAIAENGLVYVADWGNNRIQVLTPQGTVQKIFGERGLAPGQLQGPTTVCLEEGGYLLVVDSFNDRVQRFRRDGTIVSVLPGAQGLGAFTKPFSAALDPSGVVYVTQRDRHGILVLRQVWEQAYLSPVGSP
ncbi:MAG: PEGA domain-containing protein [Candidatus Eisenbacteria bacterium]|jgi:DNA-binding beta-propeller fold protein YncE|nr:PEGA domain-containing protein [Candidatus Eisenbacteria bacterium]